MGKANTFPLEPNSNRFILQINLYAFHVYFTFRSKKSTKNRPLTDLLIALDTLNLPDLH